MAMPDLAAYIIWSVDPDIFVIPRLDHPVRWYGISWALGFIISQQIMYFIYKKDGIRPKADVDELTIYMLVATMIGARLGHVLFYDFTEYLREPWRILAIWEGGLASHGGAIAIPTALYFFARKTKVRYLWMVDRLAIVAAFVAGSIRLGNLMNSEMIGIPTDVPWAFVFTRVDDVPRHPAQLYEAIHYFLLFGLLFWIWYKKKETMKDGLLTGLLLIILFGLRIVDETFKENQVAFEDDMILNMGQILSIPFILTGILILVITQRNKPSPSTVVEKIQP